MSPRAPFRLAAAALLLTVLGHAPAAAQATRTWVSGVGDDVNPCSRTAPCKTFAGAISKTAPAGIINVMDPGSFGAVTITKSLTIENDGFFAGILNTSNGNGILVNAGANDIVTIRGLSIDGVGSGGHGIRFLAGGALHVEDCVLKNFRSATSGIGLAFEPNGTSELFVTDTEIHDNGSATGGGGILIRPTATGSARVVLSNVVVDNNNFGVRADGLNLGAAGVVMTSIHGGSISGNANASALAVSGGVVKNQMMIDGTVLANNGFGPRADNGLVRYGRTSVSGNGTGLSAAAGGQLISYGTNQVHGNTVDGTPTATVGQN